MDGAADPQVTKPRRKGIQSILTGFQVLDFLLKARQPVPLRDIAAGTGLSASKLQFYLISLAEVGAIKQDAQTGYYGLGPYTLQLGIAGLQQFDVYQSAQGKMAALAQETGLTVFLVVWGNQGPTVVHRVDHSTKRPIFDLRLGAVLPAADTAIGRLFLAFLPRALTSSVQAQIGPVLNKTLLDIRRTGLSLSKGELLANHTALSAPIFDQNGRILAGITVMGPDTDFAGPAKATATRALQTVTDAVSQEAGATTQHYLDF